MGVMRSKFYFLNCFIVLFLLLSSFTAQAVEIPICRPAGYTVGFFNGVWNTEKQAEDSQDQLEKLVRETYGYTYQGEPIRFELFYNTTNGLLDVMEVFMQRSAEIDASGELGKRFEYLWGTLTGNASFLEKVKGFFPNLVSFFGWFYDSLIQKFLALGAKLFGSLPTNDDYVRHDQQLKELVAQQKKLILVAHSQGNLFVNRAVETLRKMDSEDEVKVVHVAPASAVLSGSYVLADIDWVIKALRGMGLSSLSPSNLVLASSAKDRSGHGFVETYLDGNRPSRDRMKGLLSESFMELGKKGLSGKEAWAFEVKLVWDSEGRDLDLHVLEPSDETKLKQVYYGSPEGMAGRLLGDQRLSGEEVYRVSCDRENLKEGIYRIGVNGHPVYVPKGPNRGLSVVYHRSGYRSSDYPYGVEVRMFDGTVLATRLQRYRPSPASEEHRLTSGRPTGLGGDGDPLPVVELVVKVKQEGDRGGWSATLSESRESLPESWKGLIPLRSSPVGYLIEDRMMPYEIPSYKNAHYGLSVNEVVSSFLLNEEYGYNVAGTVRRHLISVDEPNHGIFYLLKYKVISSFNYTVYPDAAKILLIKPLSFSEGDNNKADLPKDKDDVFKDDL